MNTARSQIQLALEARDEGISRVASRNGTFLETMRGVARMICQRNGTVTADDLRDWADEHGLKPTNNNAYGAIFRASEFEFVRYTISKQRQGHGNRVCVWRLKQA